MKLHLCTSQVTCTPVNKKLGVDTQYTAKVKNLWNKFAQPMISLNWSWIIIYYLHFIHQFKWTLHSRAIFSISRFHSRVTFKDVLRFEERNKNVFFFKFWGESETVPEKKNRRYKNVISPVHLIWLVYLFTLITRLTPDLVFYCPLITDMN
jgi:hypothetical protein